MPRKPLISFSASCFAQGSFVGTHEDHAWLVVASGWRADNDPARLAVSCDQSLKSDGSRS